MTQQPERAAFNAAYAGLNAAQKQAVDAIEGPVMVVAGPGTGKTQILTLRIANILLQTDTQPENILALTFTESGAKAMRDRLRRYIGAAAYRVPIFTFHGFAGRLIAEYPDAFPRVIGGRAATDLEKVDMLEQILSDTAYTLLRPMGDPTYYVPPVLRMISQLKQEYVTPDALATLIARQEKQLLEIEQFHTKGAHKGKVRGEYKDFEKRIAKNKELLGIYRTYQQLLKDQRLYDFDDMILEAVVALQHDEDMLRDLQETYQYILADEHQDVNGAQNKILEQLCNFHDAPNIFVVGDEKQAIYRFQGASLENFLYFMHAFPTTTSITLTENYRSGQTILDAAHSLMTTDDPTLAAMRVPLTAALVPQAQLTRRDFSHQAVEDDWLIAHIADKLAAGVPAQEVAVIVRTNREVEGVAARLRQAGIPVTPSADGDVLDHPITKAVQALISFVLTDSNEQALFTVLHGAYWGLSTADIVRIASARSYDRSLMSILSSEADLIELGVSNVAAAQRIITVLHEARAREVYEPPHRVLEYILDTSGFLDHVIAHEPFEGVRVVRRLYDEIEAMVMRDGVGTLRDVQEMIALRRRYGLPLQAPYIATHAQAVQVMTAHKSKGLEFSVVYMPHTQDNNWGGRAKKSLFSIPLTTYSDATDNDQFDDERRLLYVAMTRAKSELHISTAGKSIQDKEVSPSRLLEDVAMQYVTQQDTVADEAAFDPAQALRVTESITTFDASLLTVLLAERGFSATSLNNYVSNPWDFLYRNMLRIPEVQPLHMQFGTVVHNVLQQVTAWHTKEQSWPSDAQVIEWLEIQLRRLPIHTEEYTRLHEKGLLIIVPYIEHLKTTVPPATREELSIKVLLPTGLESIPELVLTGKLDRIDLDADGYAVRVVDYKTGKPKSRNAIEGKTANADGGYKRQLVFYALLLSLYDDERYRSMHGVLSFVEPTASGVIKEEAFTITPEEVAALKTDIIQAVEEITSGVFLHDVATREASEYAELARRFSE